MIKVSVIIPVYNTEKYLSKCLDSVCNQTLKDMEIICVNDCSPDDSLSILQEYAQNDNRIVIIDFTENKGVAVARNTGIDRAQGEYIGFVDSDDFIDLDFYEKLYNRAAETGADAVKGKMELVSAVPNFKKEVIYDINNYVKKNFAYFYHSFTTAIYNSEFIRTNNISFPVGVSNFEDPYFSIMAVLCYEKVEVIDSVKYYYLDNNTSLTKSKTEEFYLSGLECMKMIFTAIQAKNISKENYIILQAFLFGHIYNLSSLALPLLALKEQLELLAIFHAEVKYREEVLAHHFSINNELSARAILKHARLHFTKKKEK